MAKKTVEHRLAEYEKCILKSIELEEKLATNKSEKSSILQSLFTEHGKGPFVMEGDSYIISQRGDTFFFKLERQKKN